MALNEAERFAELGMWREAWEAVEDLPAEEMRVLFRG